MRTYETIALEGQFSAVGSLTFSKSLFRGLVGLGRCRGGGGAVGGRPTLRARRPPRRQPLEARAAPSVLPDDGIRDTDSWTGLQHFVGNVFFFSSLLFSFLGNLHGTKQSTSRMIWILVYKKQFPAANFKDNSPKN